MSTQPPPTSAERVTARQQSTPSLTKQLTVLTLGLVGAAIIAWILGTVSDTSNPVWVLPVIVSGFTCFTGLLTTSTWTMKARIAGTTVPRVTSGVYLTLVLLVGGAATLLVGTPRVVPVILFATAGVVAVLSALVRLRRRSRRARRERLRAGAQVIGSVTDDGLAEFPKTPNVKLAMVTVKFRDFTGADRWVRVPAAQSPAQPIATGDQVDLWFDSSAPGDTSKIVVEHDNGTSRIIPGPVRSGT